MGQKQQPADLISEPKKRRRVGFSPIDVGVEPKDCFTIYLVSSKSEVDAPDGFCIDPIDLSQFFDDDGKIYGYQGLKIVVWVSSLSFHSYAEVNYESSSDGGKGITDLKLALQRIFADTLVENKNDFLQSFSTDRNYIRSIVADAANLGNPALNSIDISNACSDGNASALEAFRLFAGSMPAGQLYSRLIPLVLLLVDGSSPIDVTDPRWELYVLLQKKPSEQGDTQYLLVGFSAVYRFFHYPDTCRLRLSQILVLPIYQHKGYGRYLLELLRNVAITENVYDYTVEEPLDYFQHVRTCVDIKHLLAFNSIQPAVDLAVSELQQVKLSKRSITSSFLPPSSTIEEVRKSLKINKKQFLKCWEVLIYLGLEPAEKYMENFVTFISDRVRAEILGRDSGIVGKQVKEVPSEYKEDMSFVMFKTGAGEVTSTVQLDENQANQEEQIQKLVDERVEAIKVICQTQKQKA
uniref:histone acetyltransferase n=1 Tax=Kalanchoe fedtschenkoi TaxID=63787 RepID=A0A7N1A550_KALFE